MKAYCGIDGGGSHTRLAIIDDKGNVLGTGRSHGCNPHAYSQDGIAAAFDEAFQEAAKQVDAKHLEIKNIHAGIAGAGREAEQQRIKKCLASLPWTENAKISVSSDVECALEAAFPYKPGIVLITGTGSICYGRDANGKTARAGGWGSLLDDPGSGFALGLDALKTWIQAKDDRLEAPLLCKHISEAADISEIEDVLRKFPFNETSRSKISSLAPVLLEAAEAGDAKAKEIAERNADALASLAASVIKKLKACEPLPIALNGGLMESTYYKQLVVDALQKTPIDVQQTTSKLPPLAGACLLALKDCGTEPNWSDWPSA